MRNFHAFILALALGFFVVVGLSNDYRGLAEPNDEVMRMVNFTPIVLNDSKAVEVDGIHFEIVEPDLVLTIPPDQQYAITPFKLGIHITNNTLVPLRFSPYRTLIPRIVGLDKQIIPWKGGGSNRGGLPTESDCPLIKNGESVTFLLNGSLTWINHELVISISEKFGQFFQSAPLSSNPGTYQVYLEYGKAQTTEITVKPGIAKRRTLDGFWTGHATTPFVKLRLVERTVNSNSSTLAVKG